MARESLDERIYNSLEELTILLSFMVDCNNCPLEYTCIDIKRKHKTDLCGILLKGDI